MKQKRLLTWILAVALIVSVVCFAACGDSTQATPLKGTATIVVGETTYTVDLEKAGFTSSNTAFDAMEYLAANEENFSFDANYSSIGAYIKSVSTLDLSATNAYVALFVNDSSLKDTSGYALADKTVNGTTYYYSGVGISSIKLSDGLSVLLTVATY